MPNTREKLIELLNEASEILLETVGSFNDNHGNGMRADHLIANGVTIADDVSAVAYNLSPTEQKWIPVTERLPECDQVVLCYKADRGVRTGKHLAATYADGVSAFKDCCRDYAFGATHWMPLPKPPKGE